MAELQREEEEPSYCTRKQTPARIFKSHICAFLGENVKENAEYGKFQKISSRIFEKKLAHHNWFSLQLASERADGMNGR